MTSIQDAVKPRNRLRGSDRESRAVRRSGAFTRITRPLARLVRADAGLGRKGVWPDLEARLHRLPATRYLRQRVRQLLLRALS